MIGNEIEGDMLNRDNETVIFRKGGMVNMQNS